MTEQSKARKRSPLRMVRVAGTATAEERSRALAYLASTLTSLVLPPNVEISVLLPRKPPPILALRCTARTGQGARKRRRRAT